MMIFVVVSGVDSRVIVQTSMTSDQRQSPKKLRRLKPNCARPSSSLHNDDIVDDNNNSEDAVTLSWLSVAKDRPSTSARSTSPGASSPADVDVVPDVSRLDFFRRYTARGRPFRGYRTRPSAAGPATANDRPAWRLFDGPAAGDEVGDRVTGSRTVVDRRTGDSTPGDCPTPGRNGETAVLASVVACFFAALSLTLVAVWIRRRRRRPLRTEPKPSDARNT